MPRSSPLELRRILKLLARLSPPFHRELVQGMVAELDSIADPAVKRRFALGAIAAIARLTLGGYGRTAVRALGRLVGVGAEEEGLIPTGPAMSMLTTRQVLRRHGLPFGVSLASLTLFLLVNQYLRRVPQWSAGGMPGGEIAEVVLLSVPHTLAGAATGICFPQGGVKLVVGASGAVFAVYYFSLVAGEALAEGQDMPPLIGMWMANVFLLSVALELI